MSDTSVVVDVSLADFYIDDFWTGAKEYPRIATLMGEVVDKNEPSDLAVRVKYELQDNNEVCPHFLTIHIDKNLWIYLKIPFVLEIWRSIEEALDGQEVDLKYYEKAYTGTYDQIKSFAAEGVGSAV